MTAVLRLDSTHVVRILGRLDDFSRWMVADGDAHAEDHLADGPDLQGKFREQPQLREESTSVDRTPSQHYRGQTMCREARRCNCEAQDETRLAPSCR